ncbi:arylamine N-acetyltransferase [Cytophagaceae bacterium DM2B3-1]|uniref:Arylamine N-acetyltransferase n=1 Tax=Xanthocytophaga flava TaxID=3048013 RepID=A0ABT7CUA8_9BACT|nr:arylamine N-acetyltransferase [Xanthocytophaga flavus]MDJ1497358.1 arylamine N-acetyltransferase [Xanthocytophaga flavus]
MDITSYLQRILFSGPIVPDTQTLIAIHEQHIYQVPFENLDVRYNQLFSLQLEKVYEKIVTQMRGGFCYELNLIFNWLLNKIGFSSKLISSRIFDDAGNPGPEFDHMLVHVKTDREYLADVGYGDLFIRPLEIRAGVQSDGRNFFKIEKYNDENFLLSMSPNGIKFQKKYIFNLMHVTPDAFEEICLYKQTNPESYFVKNTICTKPTKTGRVTIFNNKLIEKTTSRRFEDTITDENHLKKLLRTKFGIELGLSM